VNQECRYFVISDELELAIPEDYEHVVLGDPLTLDDVVVRYEDIRTLIEALTLVADINDGLAEGGGQRRT